MSNDEWDDFWRTLDRRQQSVASSSAEAQVEEDEDTQSEEESVREWEIKQEHAPEIRGRTGRFNRCGSCSACRAKDCGTCKNCLDKPRFGGPGIKKKACIARACRSLAASNDENDDAWEDRSDEHDRSETDQLSHDSTENMFSGRISPCNLQTGVQRRPLLPLDAKHPLAACYMLDALSRASGMPLMT